MEHRVRLGFVGVGNMGQMAHLRNYVLLPDCEVVAVADLVPDKAAAVAARHGIAGVARDHRDLLARFEVDGLVCSQPFERHGALLPELLATGKPLFTEKPIGRSRAIASALVEAGATSGAVHMVGYHKRCDPAAVHARSVVDRWRASGEVGALRYVRLTMPPGDWIAGGFAGVIRARAPDEALPPPDPAEAGVPAGAFDSFVNYYIHQINFLRWIAGPYDVSYADPSGRVLVAHARAGAVPLVLEMAPYRTQLDWQETALVCFERGWVEVSFPAPLAFMRAGRVRIHREVEGEPPTLTEPTLPWEHAFLAQARAFVRVVRGQAPPPCDAAEAALDLENARQYFDRLAAAGGLSV